ncbi:CYTH-like domain-containing protein [Triangularia verruculosa]|uniref:Thiamine-triphosphatase n=1 Tax=Triangularia verruculosa TaxID=2587418 RepID=A0AAN6XEJ7_9PEZI|nr:CYTH-like domain-containing protein [Triangularia verruculosa]
MALPFPYNLVPPKCPPTIAKHTRGFKTINLEVERKIACLAIPTLTDPSFWSQPPFTSVDPLPLKTLHDIYYDKNNLLCSNGLWVRKRNGAWQAKINPSVRIGQQHTRFEELREEHDIAKAVQAFTKTAAVAEATNNFGLDKMAEFTTYREGWRVDGDFVVVRDSTSFGWGVVEVELEETVRIEEGGEVDEGWKQRRMEEMDRRIEAFVKRYAWAWGGGQVKGKLSAYFEMMRRSGDGRKR